MWSGTFLFVKSWAIVPRGTRKKKIWLGTFFGSVLTIFISFSGSVIVFSGLVHWWINLREKDSRGSVFGQFMALKKTQFLYVTFFFLQLWNSESTVVTLPIRYDSFWYACTEQRCLFDKCGFLRTQYCGHKRIKIVLYWIAGGVY